MSNTVVIAETHLEVAEESEKVDEKNLKTKKRRTTKK